MRLLLAFRVFFVVLFQRKTALRVRDLIDSQPLVAETPESPRLPKLPEPTPAESSESKSRQNKQNVAPTVKTAKRSDALTLLSALQRDARLLDLVCESLDQYDDAQIGAAARDVLRDSRKTLDKMFGLKHLTEAPEGESIEIPSDASPVRWRVVGKESGRRGILSHAGWQATKQDLPQWSGSAEDSLVIAAAEVETS